MVPDPFSGDELAPGHVDGPDRWSSLWFVYLRISIVVALPAAVLFFAALQNMNSGDEVGLVAFSVVVGAIMYGLPLAIAASHKTLRLQRAQHLHAKSGGVAPLPTLSWTATVVNALNWYPGSLHLDGGRLRFLWAQIALQGSGEAMLDVAAEEVRAVELVPASSPREWWGLGSPLVLLLLRDGRKVKLSAYAPERLVAELRKGLGQNGAVPAGVPLELQRASFDELTDALAKRFPTLAVIAKASGEEPKVVLRGEAEALEGALSFAREAVREKGPLAPYEKALSSEEKSAPPISKEETKGPSEAARQAVS